MIAETTIRTVKKLEKQGKIDQAILVCEQFLSKYPKNQRLQHHISTLKKKSLRPHDMPTGQRQHLQEMFGAGRYEALLSEIKTWLTLHPTSYFLWNLLGNTQLKLQLFEDAELAFLNAVKLDSTRANAFVGLGDACKSRHETDQAMAYYAQALKHQPQNLSALNNLGTLLSTAGKGEEARQVLLTALKLQPQNATLLYNLSTAYRVIKDLDRAEEALVQALEIAPTFNDARYNLALVQGLQGKLPQSIKSYEDILAVLPDHDRARVEKLHHMAQICDWDGIEEFASMPKDFGRRGEIAAPFPFLAMDDDPLRQRLRSEAYASRFHTAAVLAPFTPPETCSDRRLKIGYFSADFHSHATMHLMGGLFENHDRQRYETYAYSFGPDHQDVERQRLLAHVDHFREVGQLTASEIAQIARRDGLDIAVDLKGYTGDSRTAIFRDRVAPLQVAWLGYPASMGSDMIDYVIADDRVLPTEHRDGFTEKVIFMPDSYQINDSTRTISEREFTRQDCGLPEEGFVFCCFNNSYKITPAEFDIWMRLLVECEGSVIWLLRSNPWAETNLKSEAKARGVCASRLIFADRMDVADHLARHRLADLFLDTFICNAHTTASDALWAGLPVVTKAGKQFAARVATSLLHAVNLSELVVSTAKEYEALALKFATQPALLAKARHTLTKDKCAMPLFDTQTFVKHLECGFEHIHRTYCEGEAPTDVVVKEVMTGRKQRA